MNGQPFMVGAGDCRTWLYQVPQPMATAARFRVRLRLLDSRIVGVQKKRIYCDLGWFGAGSGR